jgi:hypothetical protein
MTEVSSIPAEPDWNYSFSSPTLHRSYSQSSFLVGSFTEADNPCTAKTPVCTLHLTLRTLHIALCIACRRYSVNLELTKHPHLTKIIAYRNRNRINSRYIFASN